MSFFPFNTYEDGNRQSDNLVDETQTFFPLNMTRRRTNFQFPHITHMAYIRNIQRKLRVISYDRRVTLQCTERAIHTVRGDADIQLGNWSGSKPIAARASMMSRLWPSLSQALKVACFQRKRLDNYN